MKQRLCPRCRVSRETDVWAGRGERHAGSWPPSARGISAMHVLVTLARRFAQAARSGLIVLVEDRIARGASIPDTGKRDVHRLDAGSSGVSRRLERAFYRSARNSIKTPSVPTRWQRSNSLEFPPAEANAAVVCREASLGYTIRRITGGHTATCVAGQVKKA